MLRKVQETMATDRNMIPVLAEALKAGATHGEVHRAMSAALLEAKEQERRRDGAD